ncbi:unnamed protein product [Schistocephalus solidus]|uniref:Uncharacterized protein n=1 Tax=Schistocephalus solidus TaxID=70667 RepID=A0A183TCP7_SCHSO|nr:unnamed protein product [Schistocephalus solidus]
MRHESKTPVKPEDRPYEVADENSSNNSSTSDNEGDEYLAQGYTLLNATLDSASSDLSDEDSVPEQTRSPSATTTGVLEAYTGIATSHAISPISASTLDSELYRIIESDNLHGPFPVQVSLCHGSVEELLLITFKKTLISTYRDS